MLPKDKRLNLKKDFKWVASGQKAENDLTKLFFKFGENPFPLVGIAVSSAVFKKAVDRNRARRLISTGIENFYRQLTPGVNIVLLPKSGVLNVSSNEVISSLKQLLEKNQLISK